MGKLVRCLDDEIPRNQIPTLRRDPLRVARFPRWVEAKVVSSEVESEKWRRLLLHQMYIAIDAATDGREEDFLPQNDRVDYDSRGAGTLELELRSLSNEQRAHDA
ncbi:hypothetical protein Tco_1016917 [Tanacetum coccineum]|uniref:Uncharacterized protein n=1 Tax=Tanacetum coccineum TaxID=301880 RepID=A0ABQ5FSK9_9ASTR